MTVRRPIDKEDMKHLIVGLGNIGAEYEGTRHNVGFMVADALAGAASASFRDGRYGATATIRVKNQELLLLKPNTYMNLSGNAVRYWMQQENIPVERLLVVCDDLALPLGSLRMKPAGSAGGHNGLKNIAQMIGTEGYARLRCGIACDFARGGQIDYVLSRFTADERPVISECVATAADAVRAYALSGIQFAMNHFNRKSRE